MGRCLPSREFLQAVSSQSLGCYDGADRLIICNRPAVTSRHFGPGHFGLAWGMVSVSCRWLIDFHLHDHRS
jgi:hypothetical protein